jgi:predicted membrane channel-forming protein YqfA (hemolysin III family)
MINDNDCPNDAIVPRLFLVSSNIFFLIPCIYLLLTLVKKIRARNIRHDLEVNLLTNPDFDLELQNNMDINERNSQHNRRACCDNFAQCMTFGVDIITLLTLFLCSCAYHSCYDSYNCTRYCVTQYNYLLEADFVTAFVTLSLIVLWTHDIYRWWFKLMSWASILIYSTFGLAHLDPGRFYWGYGFCLVMIIILKIMFFAKESLNDLKQLNAKYTALGLLFAGLGLYFQLSIGPLVDHQEPDAYWWKHSLWHFFLGIALLFRFFM